MNESRVTFNDIIDTSANSEDETTRRNLETR